MTMTLIVSFAFHLLFEAPLLTLRRLWIQNGNSEYHLAGAI
uniref:Uncharacterized protein n=1 Tax=Romanomermis culicivorax TaxID=13658 RepID=A0A915J0Q0_ROMCU